MFSLKATDAVDMSEPWVNFTSYLSNLTDKGWSFVSLQFQWLLFKKKKKNIENSSLQEWPAIVVVVIIIVKGNLCLTNLSVCGIIFEVKQ